MAELKLAGWEIVVSTDTDRNPVIDIAESAGFLPGSVEACERERDGRVSVPDDLRNDEET